MKRRDFLRDVAAGSAATVLAQCARPDEGNAQAQRPRRPNVVLLLADQWRAQATGYGGDLNARTPRLDRLAGGSVNFENAVSVCPVCSPYRATLMTGRYPLTHGVFLNDVCLSGEAVSLAQAFGQAGYRTGYIGKWHLDGNGRSNFIPKERRQGFLFWRAAECTHDYNHSHYYGDSPEKLFWRGYDALAQTEEAADYLRQNKDRPFLLMVSWGPPHNPYETAPERFRQMFKPDDLAIRKNVPQKIEAAARRDLAGYYAHTAALDECVGRILDVLGELNLEENTILVFTSDHGDMLGSQGEVRKQKPWDESIRVPFLLRYPALLGAGARRITMPFASPDIMPTLLSLAGLRVPSTVEGLDRSRLILGQEKDRDDAALIACPSPFGEWVRERGGREYRGIRTRQYTYVRTLEGPWLLYDNIQDPFQLENLAGKGEHASLQAELEARLAAMLKKTRDDFRSGWDYIKKWGYKTDASGTVPYTT